MTKKLLLISTALCSLLHAAQNDIYPTDYVANKPGDIVTTLYLTESDTDEVYRHGSQILDESSELSLQALRLGYTTELWGYTTTFTAVGFHAKTTMDGSVLESLYPKSTSGYGDLRLGMTTWLINDPQNMHYFAITPMISLPVGTYDPNLPLNIGENRYKATLNLGYVDRFWHGDKGELFAELSPEIAYFGDNDNVRGHRLEQKPAYALSGYLRYRPIPITGIFAGYQINRGGETSIDGISQDDASNNERWMAGGALFAFGTQIILRYAQDRKTDNGFKAANYTTLRLQWIF